MKNSQKGFAVPLLIILALLIIGGGVYFYLQHTSGPVSKGYPMKRVPSVDNAETIASTSKFFATSTNQKSPSVTPYW